MSKMEKTTADCLHAFPNRLLPIISVTDACVLKLDDVVIDGYLGGFVYMHTHLYTCNTAAKKHST